MWRNWNPLNPPINNQSSDEDNYGSPSNEPDPNELVSPNRPHQSASASPRALLRPDPPPVQEVLEQAGRQLRNLPNREQRAENRNAHRRAQAAAEAAAEAAAAAAAAANRMPDPPVVVRYDQAGGEDDGDVYKKLSTLRTPFTKADAKFWFANFERSIKHFGVKSQVTKKEALINQLTQEAIDECKNLIALEEDEAGDTPYFDLKTELLSLFGPRPEDSYAKAA